MSGNNSRMMKVAALSFAGFCAVSVAVDRATMSPLATQLAGFCGAFIGGLAAQRQTRKGSKTPGPEAVETAGEPAKDPNCPD